MTKAQFGGMELQAFGRCKCLTDGVKFIPQDRMSDLLHVHAQLMGATRDGDQFDARRVRFACEHLPARLARPAPVMIDPLPGLVLPIGRKGQIDHALILSDMAPNPRHVELGGLALFELLADMAVRALVLGHYDDA